MKNNKSKSNSGITLIALVVTILVMLILLGVTLSLISGSNGILNRAENANNVTSKVAAKEKLELFLMSMQAEKYSNEKYNQDEYLTSKLEENGMDVEDDIVIVDGWKFRIDRSVPMIIETIGEGIQPIKITGVVENEADFTKAYLKIDIVSEKDIASITIDDENIDIPEKTDGKYTITKTVTENKDYYITVKDIEENIKTQKLTVSGLAADMEIYNVEDLIAFRDKVNSGATFEGCAVKLMSDLNLSTICGEGIGNWVPIGDYNTNNKLCFAGTFEGNNHTISNLYINNTELSYQGLFGSVKNGSISDLNVDGTIIANTINGGIVAAIRDSNKYVFNNCIGNVKVTNNAGGAGGIIGHIRDNAINTSINNCINKGEVSQLSSEEYTSGGIVGAIRDKSECSINKCTNEGVIFSEYIAAGGIVGRITENVKSVSIIECNNIAKINAKRNAGGIVGRIDNNTDTSSQVKIEKCNNTGNIVAEVYNVGGILGYCMTTKLLNVDNCNNSGIIVTETSSVGGIIGGIGKSTKCIIDSSVNNANVTATEYNAGGILGNIEDGGNVTITNSYNTANIKTETYDSSGGIVGATQKASALNVNKVYNAGSISAGRYASGGILGLSYDSGSTVEISNAYNAGEISVGTASYGGIIGSIDNSASGKISYCHNVGTLKGSKTNKGTMVGCQNASYTGTSNYWLSTCNATYSVGSKSTIGNKYTAAKMIVQSNFNGWDFDNIWEMDTTKGYPILQNMPQ